MFGANRPPKGFIPFFEALQEIGKAKVEGWDGNEFQPEVRAYSPEADGYSLQVQIHAETLKALENQFGEMWQVLVAYEYACSHPYLPISMVSNSAETNAKNRARRAAHKAAIAGDPNAIKEYARDWLGTNGKAAAFIGKLLKSGTPGPRFAVSIGKLSPRLFGSSDSQSIALIVEQLLDETRLSASKAFEAKHIPIRAAQQRAEEAFAYFCQDAEEGEIQTLLRTSDGTREAVPCRVWGSNLTSFIFGTGCLPVITGSSKPAKVAPLRPDAMSLPLYVSKTDLGTRLRALRVSSNLKRNVSEDQVRRWFREHQNASKEWTKPIEEWIEEAVEAFPGLSNAQAGKLCRSELEETGANWDRRGRPPNAKKSLNKTPK